MEKNDIIEFAKEIAGEDYASCAVVIASFETGPSCEAIAEKTGLPLKDVRRYGRRLRKGNIWANGQIHLDIDPDDADSIVTAISLGSLVADGMLKRSPVERKRGRPPKVSKD